MNRINYYFLNGEECNVSQLFDIYNLIFKSKIFNKSKYLNTLNED